MQRSFISRAWYQFVRLICRGIGFVYFRVRFYHRERIPKSGAFLLLSNHQSFLDPPLIGMVVPQRINYLARQTLFDNPVFGAFIRSLDAIPIDRDGLGIGGLKESLRRLKRGEPLLLFPEGTRSRDGEIQPLKAGFSALVDRGNAAIVPIAIDGAHRAFPPGAKFPRPTKVCLLIGEPIACDEARTMDDRALVDFVERRLRELHAEVRRLRA